jgi:hypothetical protein
MLYENPKGKTAKQNAPPFCKNQTSLKAISLVF